MLLFSFVSYAQNDSDESLPTYHPPKLGGAVGFTPSALYLDFSPINQVLSGAGATPLSTGPLVMTGGQGYAYILVVQNLRVGGIWGSGSRSSASVIGTTERDVQLSAGYGGVTVDYVLPLTARLDITGGILLGGGSLNLKLTRNNGSPVSWDPIWTEFGSNNPVQSYTRNLSGSFFAYQPTVNLEYAVLRWLGLRVGAGYMGMAGSDWKEDDNYSIVGVPGNISGKGFVINAGLFVGTFIF